MEQRPFLKVLRGIMLVLVIACVGTSALVAQVESAPGEPREYQIGDIGPAGGFVFYDKGYPSDGWQYLEAGSRDIGSGIPWSASKISVTGTNTAIGMGKRNSELIRESGETIAAALAALHYSQGGYTDWFLPSSDELNFMYTNLKLKKLGGFSGAFYWSSSQAGASSSYCQRFLDGSRDYNDKTNTYSVRAIRAF